MTRGRILVTDTQERSGLACVRSLAQAGFEVTALANGRLGAGLWSRAAAAGAVAPDPGADLEGFLGRLESILRSRQHALVLACNDETLLAVSSQRERLLALTALGLPPKPVVERVLDRGQVALAAARAGIPTPASQACASVSEALAAAADFGYPVLVKPPRVVWEERGTSGGAASKIARRRAALAQDADALATIAADLGQGCRVEQRLSGPVASLSGVADEQGLLAYVGARHTRIWPRQAGNACFSETFDPPRELIAAVEGLLAALEWVGIFQLEMIELDGGEFAAIDFNPRPYGSIGLAVAAGVPLPALWCQCALGSGRNGAPRSAAAGITYRWAEGDVRNLVAQLRLDPGPRSWTAALRPAAARAYFEPADPAPALARAAELVRKAADRG